MAAKGTDIVTILGGGIVGICCALSLLERGRKVRLIDKSDPGQATSYGNAGVISPWSCVPQSMPGLWRSIPGWLIDPQGPVALRWRYLPKVLPWTLKFLRAGRADRVTKIAAAMAALNRPNVDLYRHHLGGTGEDALVADSWYIYAHRNPEDASLDTFAWRLRLEHGAPAERVSGDVLREIEPALSPDFKAAILMKDQARARLPGRLGQVLAEKARAMGATIDRREVSALSPQSDGSWQLHTDHGVEDAATLVIAAGPWSRRLLQPLGIDLPLEYERGYHMEFHNSGVTLTHSIMDVDRKFVTSSMENGIRSAGTAEFGGFDAEPDMRRADILKPLTKQLLPGLNTDETSSWSGVRPSFPDSLPCIGALPGYQNLFAAFGHSHYGLGMAPGTGRLVADLVMGTTPNIDVSPYRAERFLGPGSGPKA